MISLQTTDWGQITLYAFTCPNGTIIEFLPGYGAGLNGLHVQTASGAVNLVEGYTSPEDIEKSGRVRYLGTFLFPFPNRTKGGQYQFGGKSYQFPLNESARNNALHGMLFNKPFVVAGIFTDGEHGKIEMVYRDEHPPAYYPFPYEVRIRWQFTGESLECFTSVVNIGESAMPVGFGWHPYFKSNNPVNQWKVQLPVGEEFVVDENMIPTGEMKAFSSFEKPAVFGETHFDTGLKLAASGAKAVSSFEDAQSNIKVEVWQELGEGKYNYLQVYSPPDRNMLAIEPMTCPANALQSGESVRILEPGEKQNATFGIIWQSLT
jgi:aldose 1-epimerase